MSEDIEVRRRVAGELLGGACLGEAWGGYADCPGMAGHTGKNGVKDFRVLLEGAPTGYCLHTSCSGAVAAFNKELRRRIWFAENPLPGGGGGGRPAAQWAIDEGLAAEPRGAKQEKRLKLDRAKVELVVKGAPVGIDREWLRKRSPVDVRSCGLEGFFAALYAAGERVLVFTKFTSQGDFLWWVGDGKRPDAGYRLGREQGVKAVASKMPATAPCGVWFLCNPVDGGWHPVKHLSANGRKMSRRSEGSVTSWRYLVLESDELEEALWLRVLSVLKLPIAAIYTSGGKSIHALVRLNADSKPEWDALRDNLSPLLTALGADGAAMSGVRLTRLPFCTRPGYMKGERPNEEYVKYGTPRKQELLWLDAEPDARGLVYQAERRG